MLITLQFVRQTNVASTAHLFVKLITSATLCHTKHSLILEHFKYTLVFAGQILVVRTPTLLFSSFSRIPSASGLSAFMKTTDYDNMNGF